jgi:hypothetical protein
MKLKGKPNEVGLKLKVTRRPVPGSVMVTSLSGLTSRRGPAISNDQP